MKESIQTEEKKKNFLKTVCLIAIPVALQCMLQSSFSIIDQIMIGKLGKVSIAAVGLAGKFSSIFSVVVAAVGAVAGIMIAQYIGAKDDEEVNRSFSVNLLASVVIALLFIVMCVSIPEWIMRMYSKNTEVCVIAAGYLRMISMTFLPVAGATMLATMLRCMEHATLPLIASIAAAIVNTGLNYVLIFGKFGFVQLGVSGAAIATVAAQFVNFLIMFAAFLIVHKREKRKFHFSAKLQKMNGKQYFVMLLPILANEFLWSLGENVYAAIYGNLGTDACAAMTLTYSIQGLLIGALSGLAQAAGIIIGKELGKKEYDSAYNKSKKLVCYGLAGAVLLSVFLIMLKGFYVDIFNVEEPVKQTAREILIAFAVISPVKVLNMILSGGIIRSGGDTKIVMYMDIIGTWGIGVPLGLLSAFVLKLPIPYVYFILSLEEAVRLMIAVVVFKRKKWMRSI
ncbi:MAG: MATE family efflux transporter [Lachnospiraceae bacterium]|nr:MATE family efflux transporter [Lachnospiraceae bacterium]